MKVLEAAKKYLSNGYSVIPVNALKQPTIYQWGIYQIKPMTLEDADVHFKDAHGLALIMGGNHSLTAIDLDMKYALTSDLYGRIKDSVPVEILSKLYMQSTKNNGHHWVFSCPQKLEDNQKIAQRESTVIEKHETYLNAFNNLNTRETALKIATNDKTRVLIETRGRGGYIVMPPTPGYEYGSGKINALTAQEYDILMECMRSFNEYTEIHRDFKVEKYRNSDVNPFEIYNSRGDALGVLLKNGWDVVTESGNTVRLRRPGISYNQSSGLYDTERKIFNVFSTSTVFDVGKGYTQASVFLLLECDNDATIGYRKLLELGYGEQEQN